VIEKMSAEPIEVMLSKILQQYNKSPEGWNVISDHRGNIIVLGPKTNYWLRLVPISPNNYAGTGIQIDGSSKIEQIVKDTPHYGLRPLSRRDLSRLLRTFQSESRVHSDLIEKMLKKRPEAMRDINKIRPRAVLSGPILAHPDLSAISRGQRELERKLKMEAEKLFRERYPSRASLYV